MRLLKYWPQLNFLNRMLSKEEKKRRKKESWKQEEAKERVYFLEDMPVSIEKLKELIKHLESNLNSCDDRLTLTMDFLSVKEEDEESYYEWFLDNGAHCDCEVIYNISETLDTLFSIQNQSQISAKREDRGSMPSVPKSSIGFDFSNLPKPWKVGKYKYSNVVFKIKFGNKVETCYLEYREKPLTKFANFSNNKPISFWSKLIGNKAKETLSHLNDVNYWQQVLNLDTTFSEKDDIEIKRNELLINLDNVLVINKGFRSAVYWYIFDKDDNNFYFVIESDIQRYKGHASEIEKLFNHLIIDRNEKLKSG